LEDLQRSLELDRATLTVLTRSRMLKRLFKYVINPGLIRPLARFLRLFNYGCESVFDYNGQRGAGGELSIRTGLLRRITFIDGGYYQNSAFWTSPFPSPAIRIKPALEAAAADYLRSLGTADARMTFVHVRRGDYLSHTDYGLEDLALPASFYRSAIAEQRTRIGASHLVFVTDDPPWVRDTFADIEDKSIVSSTADMDFAIMTQCGSGILSNSTFALSAALLVKNPSILIAPKFWLGFRVGQWLPPRISLDHPKMIYVAVEA
jgi:hypothetical protein